MLKKIKKLNPQIFSWNQMVWHNVKFSQYGLSSFITEFQSISLSQWRNCPRLQARALPELRSLQSRCIATLPHPPTHPFAALHFFWSGTSLLSLERSLSISKSCFAAPWTPPSDKPKWPWSTQGFPFRSNCSQWFLTNFLNKRAQGLQEAGKKEPNQQISMFTILIRSLGIYLWLLSWEKQPALCSKRSRQAQK